MNIGRVYFALRGENIDPAAATRVIGVTPSCVTLKREGYPRLSSWEFSTEKVEAELVDVYDMADSVIQVFLGKEPQIKRVARESGAEVVLQVVLTISSNERLSTPAVGFSQMAVKFIAEVGGYIDIDTYRGES